MRKITLLMLVLSFIFAGCSSNTEQKQDKAAKEATQGAGADKSSAESADQKDYTFDEESFKYAFTVYAAEDKSYKINGVTFTEYAVNSPDKKLNGTSIEVKLASFNTIADLNNGKGGEWPASMGPIRDNNVINGFFKKLAQNETASAKVIGVDASNVEVEVTLNDVTKVLKMPYTITDGVLTATASTDVVEYNAADAFKNLVALCTGYHYGKSWSDVDLTFSVKVQ